MITIMEPGGYFMNRSCLIDRYRTPQTDSLREMEAIGGSIAERNSESRESSCGDDDGWKLRLKAGIRMPTDDTSFHSSAPDNWLMYK